MILDEIAHKTKERVTQQKSKKPVGELIEQCKSKNYETGFPFETALKGKQIQFICEVKKASPSKGVIAGEFPYLQIAKEYEQAGAAAISVLTEPYYFQGSDHYLKEIVQAVKIPVLRKDFVVDEYMIYEAKLLGASAILLICAILKEEQLQNYLKLAHSLGLSALVETHDASEIAMALRVGARIIGVNNRNLKDFSVDITHSSQLRELVPKEVIFVSESGIRNAKDVQLLRENGTDAVLIGELLMKSDNKAEMLQKLRNGRKECL